MPSASEDGPYTVGAESADARAVADEDEILMTLSGGGGERSTFVSGTGVASMEMSAMNGSPAVSTVGDAVALDLKKASIVHCKRGEVRKKDRKKKVREAESNNESESQIGTLYVRTEC